jgi:hypothetical protein
MKMKILRAIWKGVKLDDKVMWNEDEGTAGVWDEGLFIPILVKCADCNLITTASIEDKETRMEGHNGIWADCPACDITGYDKIILVHDHECLPPDVGVLAMFLMYMVNDFLTPTEHAETL